MRTRSLTVPSARRDLVVIATAVVGASRLVDGPIVWAVAGVLLVATLLGTLQALAEDVPGAATTGVPVEALLTPAVAAAAGVGLIRLVPAGLWLVPALLVVALVLDRCLATEARLLSTAASPGPGDRATVLVQALVVGFLGFAGVAALVPGGLAEPAPAPRPGAVGGLAGPDLLLLATADAAIAGLLGYRAAALRLTSLRDALWSAATYAAAVGIAAAAFRAMVIPRLLGPALLTLVFFLWDAFHGAPPARRRDPRWIWQTVLLVVLGVVVMAWNLRIR